MESENLTTPSSQRVSGDAKGQTTRPYSSPADELSRPSSQRSAIGATPLAESLSDLADARKEIEKAGMDEPAVIAEIAERIRQRVAKLPRGTMEPLTDSQIDEMVDTAVQQVLARQKKRVSTLVAHSLKMSSTRAAVRLLAADRAEQLTPFILSKTLRTPAGVAMSNAPRLLTLGREQFPHGLHF